MTRHFHEKAGSCQAVFLVVSTIQPDCRPTGGTISLQPFLLGKVFCSAIDTADRRPAGGAQCCIPNSQITDSPYFHPHSLWSYCPGASWVSSIGNGCCRLGAELNVSVFSDIVPGACRSHPNSAICSYSPSSGSFLLLLSCVVIAVAVARDRHRIQSPRIPAQGQRARHGAPSPGSGTGPCC